MAFVRCPELAKVKRNAWQQQVNTGWCAKCRKRKRCTAYASIIKTGGYAWLYK